LIHEPRLQTQRAVECSPSLRPYSAEQLNACYQKARRTAAKQTEIALQRFPGACPFRLDDILSEDWLPDTHD
jgi:hypothetical protein